MSTSEFVARAIVALAGSVFALAFLVGIVDRIVGDDDDDKEDEHG